MTLAGAVPPASCRNVPMKEKHEIVTNWLPRYTGVQLGMGRSRPTTSPPVMRAK